LRRFYPPHDFGDCCGTDQRAIEVLALEAADWFPGERNPLLSYEMKFSENVTILGLPSVVSVLHIVCPLDSQRYYLLLTGIHRLLAPLFTIIRTYSEPQPASPP
jgi:hypothetical protein